jgi:hypothetical protein
LRVRLIDGMNCTPMVFKEKPLSQELTVPVLGIIRRSVGRLPNRLWQTRALRFFV